MSRPSSAPRGEHAPRPGVTWETALGTTGEHVVPDDEPTPRASRATRRAERAEQQLAAVRRVARNYPGLRHLHAALDDGEPADDRDRWDTFDARPGTTDYTRQQQLAAGQPECTECGDTGACNGGPCAHPDAAPSR